jgi:hypothetical protein
MVAAEEKDVQSAFKTKWLSQNSNLCATEQGQGIL